MIDILLPMANTDGVIEIDSHIPGPTIGIVAITHGNEPAGVFAIQKLIVEYGITSKLQKGKILFILNNIEAHRQNRRFIDRDMNRLWNETGIGYEYDRRDQILTYIDQCDHLLDLHSTSSPSVPMAIDARDDAILHEFVRHTDVQYSIHGIMPYLSGKAITAYHHEIHPQGISITIECGSHQDAEAGNIAYENALRLLSFLEVIPTYNYAIQDIQFLQVIAHYNAPSIGVTDFVYSSEPKSFDIIAPSTYVAQFGEDSIYSPDEETLILMPTKYSQYAGDSLMYFTRRI